MSVTDLRPTGEASMLPGTDLPPGGVPGYADVWPTPRQGALVQVRRLARRSALIGAVLLASLLLALLFGPAAAIVPVLLVLGAWGLFVVPFGVVAPAVVGLLLSISNPSLNPAENKWRSPLLPIGKALFTIMPIKLAPADILIGVLVIRALMIVVLGDWGAGIDRRPTRQFAQAALAGIAAISIWTVYGLATGGSFKNMLWQVRPLMWLPCFALAASVAAATRRGRHENRRRSPGAPAGHRSARATAVLVEGGDLLRGLLHAVLPFAEHAGLRVDLRHSRLPPRPRCHAGRALAGDLL